MPDQTELLQARVTKVADKSLDMLEGLMEMEAGADFNILKLQAMHAQQVLSKAGYGDTTNQNINQKTASANILSPEEQELIRAQAAKFNAGQAS